MSSSPVLSSHPRKVELLDSLVFEKIRAKYNNRQKWKMNRRWDKKIIIIKCTLQAIISLLFAPDLLKNIDSFYVFLEKSVVLHNFWLQQEPKGRQCRVCVTLFKRTLKMSSSSILKSSGGSRASRQASKKAGRQASRQAGRQASR